MAAYMTVKAYRAFKTRNEIEKKVTQDDPPKVSHKHNFPAPVLAFQIPTAITQGKFKTGNIFEGSKTDMEELADKAILDTVKVSHRHVIFAPLLAPQTPPEDIIANIDQIYKKEIDKVKSGGQEATGLTEEFFVRYRTTDQEARTSEKGIKVSNEHQDFAPALAPTDTNRIFAKSTPPTVLEGILGSMSVQAKKALVAKQKVSNKHKTTLPGLAPKDTFKARLDEEIDVILINMLSIPKRPLSPATHTDAGATKKTHKEKQSANGDDN